MTKFLTFSKDAEKTLRRMPSTTANLIVSKMEQYATSPESLANNMKRLRGQPLLRLRIGDWRVLFTENGEVIAVIKIASRGSVYE